jgi:hypothetical protein
VALPVTQTVYGGGDQKLAGTAVNPNASENESFVVFAGFGL